MSDVTSAIRRRFVRGLLVGAVMILGAAVIITGQTSTDAKLQVQLRKLFPAAAEFSAKEGDPPHFKAYVNTPAPKTIAGYVFWTTELQPLERGYDGPIKILVGMDTKGILTGVLVVEHHEPFGNISVDLPAFPLQFVGKSVQDPFKVGADVDAVTQASITITSASRAIRNSARRMARSYLTPVEPSKR